MFNYETVYDYLSTVTGRKINTDHVVSNFWHLNQKFFGFSDTAEKMKCLGGSYPHQYSLNYLSEFLINYKGLNRFAYTHLSIAHEKSGTRLKLADRDFPNFLKYILNYYNDIDEDIVFLLLSDHGRPKISPVKIESNAEKMLPFTFIISNKAFIGKLKAHNNLKINTNRLVSRYDLHKTLHFLSNTIYEPNSEEISNEYNNKNPGLKKYNLFLENIPSDRTCEEVGVPESKCMCKQFQEISIENWEKNFTLNYLVYESIKNLNQVNKDKINKNKCSMISFQEVTKLSYMVNDNNDDFAPIYYKIEFITSPYAYIQVLGSTASAERYVNSNSLDKLNTHIRYEFTSKTGEKTHSLAKIWEIKRIDKDVKSVTQSFCDDFLVA